MVLTFRPILPVVVKAGTCGPGGRPAPDQGWGVGAASGPGEPRPAREPPGTGPGVARHRRRRPAVRAWPAAWVALRTGGDARDDWVKVTRLSGGHPPAARPGRGPALAQEPA